MVHVVNNDLAVCANLYGGYPGTCLVRPKPVAAALAPEGWPVVLRHPPPVPTDHAICKAVAVQAEFFGQHQDVVAAFQPLYCILRKALPERPITRFFATRSSSCKVCQLPVVGIELRRARCRWRVTVLALSIARWVHISTMATFPEAPPISRSRSDAVSLRFSLPVAPRFIWGWDRARTRLL